jgi:hypothetical protein
MAAVRAGSTEAQIGNQCFSHVNGEGQPILLAPLSMDLDLALAPIDVVEFKMGHLAGAQS